MNRLDLCRRLASETGTIDGPNQPPTTIGQTGRLAKIVNWIDDAYTSIQLAHRTWRFMQGEFLGDTVANQKRYTGSQLGISARFGDWVCKGDSTEDRYSLYDPAIGLNDEGQLRFVSWDRFFPAYVRGPQTAAKPIMFSIDDAGQIVFAPTPDKAYKVRGPYRKSVQVMSADSDIPDLPADHHDVIWKTALIIAATHDEAGAQLPLWRMRKIEAFLNLERDQLPMMSWAAPLA